MKTGINKEGGLGDYIAPVHKGVFPEAGIGGNVPIVPQQDQLAFRYGDRRKAVPVLPGDIGLIQGLTVDLDLPVKDLEGVTAHGNDPL